MNTVICEFVCLRHSCAGTCGPGPGDWGGLGVTRPVGRFDGLGFVIRSHPGVLAVATESTWVPFEALGGRFRGWVAKAKLQEMWELVGTDLVSWTPRVTVASEASNSCV